jgi:hypothetical protein
MGAENTKIESNTFKYDNGVNLYPAPKKESPPPTNGGRALVIAITYSKTNCPLNGTFNDASVVKSTIRKKGFSESNIIFLTDNKSDPHSVYYPTSENIVRAIRWLFSSSSKEDFENSKCDSFGVISPKQLCFMYYSGHGTQVKDTNGDEVDGKDEAICPVRSDGYWDEDITDDKLAYLVNTYTNESSVVASVFDCCHSGSNMDLPFVLKSGYVRKNANYPSTKCKMIHLAGCLDSQSSYEGRVPNGTVQGYLTYSWCSIMSLSNRPALFHLEMNIKEKVSRLVRSSNQLPVMSLGRSLAVSELYPL